MKKVLTLIAIATLATGCASTTMTPAEQHQADKSRFYDEFNQGQHSEIIKAYAETEAALERASNKEFVWQ